MCKIHSCFQISSHRRYILSTDCNEHLVPDEGYFRNASRYLYLGTIRLRGYHTPISQCCGPYNIVEIYLHFALVYVVYVSLYWIMRINQGISRVCLSCLCPLVPPSPPPQNTLKMICLSNILTLSIPDEGYSRNASCAINQISTLLVLSLGRYLSAGGLLIHESIISSQCFETDMVD